MGPWWVSHSAKPSCPSAASRTMYPHLCRIMRAQSSDGVFILHEKNDFGAPRRISEASGRSRSLVHGHGDCRQDHRESGAFAQFGLQRIAPPLCSTIPRTVARPRPVPLPAAFRA